jgi:hypothetical protein
VKRAPAARKRTAGYLQEATLLLPPRRDPEVARLVHQAPATDGSLTPEAQARRTGFLAHQLLGHRIITKHG